MKGIFEVTLNTIKGIAEVILSWFGTTWNEAWAAIKEFFTGLWEALVLFFTGAMDGIKNTVSSVLNAISQTFTNIWNAIKATVTSVINAIRTVITNVWNAIKEYISSTLNNIRNTASSVWNNIKTTITTIVNAVRATISNVWNAIKTASAYAVFDWNGKEIYRKSGPKVPYLVRVTKEMEIRKGPGTRFGKTDRKCPAGLFTIVEVKSGWGRLKNGAGWILLSNTEKI